MLGIIFSLGASLLSFAFFIGVIVLVINIIKNKDKGLNFKFKSLWVGYLYLISMISLVAMLVGLSMVFRSSFTRIFEPQFSYPLNYYNQEYERQEVKVGEEYESKPVMFEDSMYKEQTKVEVDGKVFYYDQKQIRQDLIQGITLAISMAVLFAIHRTLSMRVKDDSVNMWNKAYVFFGLIITSILSLILIPTSIYQLVNYLIEGWQNLVINNPYSTFAPGEAISAMIVFVPAWLVFIYKVNKVNRSQEGDNK